MPVGTLINVATVAVGSLLGVLIGNRLPERFRETAMVVIGLVTLVLGVQMASNTRNILITLVSALLGGILGEWLRIDLALERAGRWIEARVVGGTGGAVASETAPRTGSLATAFVTASLIFCVGPMTIVGSIQDGLTGDYQLLAIKSLLDLFASLTLASTLGWGVGLSTLTILVVQGGLSLLVSALGTNATALVSERTILAGGIALPLGSTMLDEMSAVGGVLMLGIGLLLLDLKRVRVANLLPAIAIAPVLVWLVYALGVPVAP